MHTRLLVTSAALLLPQAAVPGDFAAPHVIWVDQAAAGGRADGSADAPFAELSRGLAAAVPGSTVVVRAGVYREQVSVSSGTETRPITIRAADGERAVLSGMERITGWQPRGGGVYQTTVDWRPTALFQGDERLTPARHPDSGWWTVDAVGQNQFTDEALIGLDAPLAGSQFFVWQARGNAQFTVTITAFQPESGTVTYASSGSALRIAAGDLYWLENVEALISRTGEWAIRPDGARYQLIVKVDDPAQLADLEAPRREQVVRLGSHTVFSGFTVEGATHYAVFVQDEQSVVVSGNVIARNLQYGVWLRNAKHVDVLRNVMRDNLYGVNLHTCTAVTIEQNDIGCNLADGLRLTWDTSDVIVRQNYIHHHLHWSHPDGIQTFRKVSNILIEDNLLLANGQSIMLQETDGVVLRGNAVIGSASYMAIFGHDNTNDVTLEKGTFAFSGYGLLRMTGANYLAYENVFMVGHSRPAYTLDEGTGYAADRNLLWNSDRATHSTFSKSADGRWLRDWQTYQASTSQDQQSMYASPEFVNAPVALDAIVTRNATTDALPLRKHAGLFHVGDYVEVNFDGVVREVLAVENSTLMIAPALDAPPVAEAMIANWGSNANFTLDVRVKPGSPGATLSASGGPVGTELNAAAYQAGDFNDDGRRDIPAVR
jgi:hypothetical protein